MIFGRASAPLLMAAVTTLALGAPGPVAAASPETPAPVLAVSAATPPKAGDLDMNGFLDRLMLAESGGRNDARSPRSTAVGPYQFIESTWLDLARRIFATETQTMTPAQILALRTDRTFARRGAEAYTRENAAILKSHGLEATFPHLRLAFLLGPQGAARILKAPPQTRVTALLGPAVANANPFMYGLTAEGLIARAAHDLAVSPATLAGIAAGDISPSASGGARSKGARIAVRCNLALVACRRWQALAVARTTGPKAVRRQLAANRKR